MTSWNQVCGPLGSTLLSTPVAALPVATMLVALAFLHVRAHIAAIASLVVGAVNRPPGVQAGGRNARGGTSLGRRGTAAVPRPQ